MLPEGLPRVKEPKSRVNHPPRRAEVKVMSTTVTSSDDQDDRVDLDSVAVSLLLDACHITATIYLAPELGRFSEAWESVMRDHRLFIPVTQATISTLTGQQVGERAEFMQIRKADIRAVCPLDNSR